MRISLFAPVVHQVWHRLLAYSPLLIQYQLFQGASPVLTKYTFLTQLSNLFFGIAKLDQHLPIVFTQVGWRHVVR